MSAQQPPYGQKLIRGWFGESILVNDPDVPPPGFRFTIDFLTAKKVLVPLASSEVTAIEGIDSQGHDGNVVHVPHLGSSRVYSFATPDPSKITAGHEFTGPRAADANPDPKLRTAGRNRYNSTGDGAAIF